VTHPHRLLPTSAGPRLAAALIVGALFTAACSNGGAATDKGPAPRPVHVATLNPVPFGDGVHAVGLLAPKDQARLAFKIGGYVESINVEEGAPVKAGQLLAVLKQTEIAAAVEQARQSAAKTQRDLDRVKALYADGVATLEQYEDLETAHRVAAAALRSAEFNGDHARILAPGDGVVLQKLVDVNELVQSGQPVLVVGKAGRGWVVRVGLADRDRVRVHAGDAADIAFDAWPGRRFSGRVGNVAAAADPGTGTYMIEVAVDPGESGFVQGLVAKVTLAPHDLPSVAALPLQALVEANGSEAGVFVLDPDGAHVHRLTARIGRVSGGQVEVLAGIAPGARVVTDGAAFLENGSPVRVTP
jgi:RND family efflux transporter MFP subunit